MTVLLMIAVWLSLSIGLVGAQAPAKAQAPKTPAPTKAQGTTKYTVKKDIDYLPAQDYANGKDRVDIYTPRAAKAAPVILMFHGGGLTSGDRASEASFAQRLAEAGYVVAAASYRLSPAVQHPAHIEDAAAAFAWLQKNARAHGGDPSRIFVAGYSAGGYLAALLGSDPSYLKAHGLGHRDIDGLVLIAPTFNVGNRPAELKAPWGVDAMTWRSASPTTYFGSHVPPTLSVIGDQDEPWRLEDNRTALALLKKSGQSDATLTIVEGRNHESIRDLAGKSPEDVDAHIIAFIRRLTGRSK